MIQISGGALPDHGPDSQEQIYFQGGYILYHLTVLYSADEYNQISKQFQE